MSITAHALIEKRAELSGEIAALQEQIAALEVTVHHLDATLKLFASNVDPAAIKPIRRRGVRAGRSLREITRPLLDILRLAGREGLQTGEVVSQLLQRRGFVTPDDQTIANARGRVTATLLAMRTRGTIERIGEPRHGHWRIREDELKVV